MRSSKVRQDALISSVAVYFIVEEDLHVCFSVIWYKDVWSWPSISQSAAVIHEYSMGERPLYHGITRGNDKYQHRLPSAK